MNSILFPCPLSRPLLKSLEENPPTPGYFKRMLTHMIQPVSVISLLAMEIKKYPESFPTK